jgi:hypothetical protein
MSVLLQGFERLNPLKALQQNEQLPFCCSGAAKGQHLNIS